MRERGETLTETELAFSKPIEGEGGKTRRAFCPFHGSDKQRSLRVSNESGRFECFACGVWGYMDWARERYGAGQGENKIEVRPKRAVVNVEPTTEVEALGKALQCYQEALPGSVGEEYLADRGISLELARKHGIGYSAAGRWLHRDSSGRTIRDWKWGRVVFPHTGPGGTLWNLYGRAVGDRVPKHVRHDHLPGRKGYFNFPALTQVADGPLFVCEGPFDALSIESATGKPAIAIFGVQGWRMEWLGSLKDVIFALDGDDAGQKGWRKLAQQLVLRGCRVRVLEPESYGNCKDPNEAWVCGELRVE